MSGRLDDIPYWTSPPLIFTYRETAPVAAGAYTFLAGTKAVFTPSRPIRANALYVFKTLDFSFDIDQSDYMGAYTTLPLFSMYLQSDSAAPALREPIPLSKYFDTIPYVLNILGAELLEQAYPGQTAITTQEVSYNRLLGSVEGVVAQTAALLGKASLTATIVFTVQEVVDEHFISEFKALAGGHGRGARGREFA